MKTKDFHTSLAQFSHTTLILYMLLITLMINFIIAWIVAYFD